MKINFDNEHRDFFTILANLHTFDVYSSVLLTGESLFGVEDYYYMTNRNADYI